MSAPRNTAAHSLVRKWKWLDGFGNFFGAIVGGFYKLPGTRPIKTLLHGTWPLHHPLHPAVTDLTIGGYTAAVAVDLLYLITREPGLLRAADFLIIASFITSLISIVSGLTDWNETYDEERRTGMLHGLLMVVASVGFVISIWLRLAAGADQRDLAIGIALAAWVVLIVASYFGGEMVFGYGTEVNRVAWTEVPTKWERLDLTDASLEDRKPVVAKAKSGVDLFVVKLDGKINAMVNTCTHAGGPLNEGKWVGADRCEIQCPWHGSQFCVKDGGVRHGPATFSEVSLEVRTDGSGRIEVRARD
ncbi:MAG TPA: DUF2231 domain-containing protein [Candidatus Limnocylindria bacterium]|nr:DUF2231 domain-containing protein [Candidatus Limnocylindria bacterium]